MAVAVGIEGDEGGAYPSGRTAGHPDSGRTAGHPDSGGSAGRTGGGRSAGRTGGGGSAGGGGAAGGAGSEKQALLDGSEGLGRGMLWQANALQVFAEGCWRQGCNEGTAAGHQRGSLTGAQQATARVAMDIGALGLQLFSGNGLHVAIASGKEGRAGGSAV